MNTKAQAVKNAAKDDTLTEEFGEIKNLAGIFEDVVKRDISPEETAEIKKFVKGHHGTLSADIKKIVDANRGEAGSLIRVLQQVQGLVGYLPKPVIAVISRDLDVPFSEVYGVTSFYHFFSMKPKGIHVLQVCMGTSCYVKGGGRILDQLKKELNLEPGGITPDGRFSLEIVRCLGACGLSPVMAVGTDIHARVKPGKLSEILDSYN